MKPQPDELPAPDDTQKTSQSFIQRLQAFDEDSWTHFYDKYAPVILNFAKKRGCSGELAEDVLQETVISLFKHLPKFNYMQEKGRFRSYLFRIVESKIVDAYRRTRPEVHVDVDNIRGKELLEGGAEDKSFLLWDKAVEEQVLRTALENVKNRSRPETFKCFVLTYLDNMKVGDIARKMGINPNLVSQNKHKIKQLVIEEAKRLKEHF